jgi:hypothetical protein
VLTTIKEMSVCTSLFLDKIKADLNVLGVVWNPRILQEEPVHVFQLTHGILWAPTTGLHVIQTLVDVKVWKYFEKHHEGITLIQMDDEFAILGERFPRLKKLPR